MDTVGNNRDTKGELLETAELPDKPTDKTGKETDTTGETDKQGDITDEGVRTDDEGEISEDNNLDCLESSCSCDCSQLSRRDLR